MQLTFFCQHPFVISSQNRVMRAIREAEERSGVVDLGRSSGKGPSHRNSPATLTSFSGDAVLIGEENPNVGRTPAKLPFAGVRAPLRRFTQKTEPPRDKAAPFLCEKLIPAV